MTVTQVTGEGKGRRYSAALAAEAAGMALNGWTVDGIRRVFANRGVHVSKDTVRRWVDPEYRERRMARVLDHRAQVNAANAQFLLNRGRCTQHYKAAFARRLRREQVPATSIAKVMTVVFGETWTYDQVKAVLQREEATAA